MGFHQKSVGAAAALCVALVICVTGTVFAEGPTIRAVDQPVVQVFPQGQHYPSNDPSDGSTKPSGETTLGHTAQVDPFEGIGPDITAPGTPAAPTIDGVLSPGEWADALAIDISIVAAPVMMYLKHDGSYLYAAFVDENDSTNDAYDQVGIYFDDEGGTPPILYDDIWTAPTCPADEGNFWIGNFAPDPDDQFRGWADGPTACTVQYGGTGVQVAYSVSGGFMTYEVAIDLASSAIQATQGETLGWRIYVADQGADFNGYFPANSVFNDPSTYSNLTLGFVGEAVSCGGAEVQFEDGIPITWTNTDNGGPFAWVTTADPDVAPNETGGTGEAAIADADAFNVPGDPYDAELWTNSFSLATASAANLDLRWRHRALNNSTFNIDVSDDGGGSWTGLVGDAAGNPGGAAGDAASLDLTPWAGADDVTVRFRFQGNAWDYYAQVDEIALNCTQPAITMVKTVGTVDGVCATTDTIVVPPGTDVYYCYTVTNTGNTALGLHDLVDDQLGTILDDLAYDLQPGASVEVTLSAVNITTTTVNTATWTAFNPDPVEADQAEATDDATVVVLENDTCDDAIELTCPAGGGTFSVLGSTLLASYTGPFDCITSHTAPDLWYKIMGNGGGITASTCSANTNYDTKLSSFDGTCGALGCVIGDDDDSSCGFSALQTTINWTSVVDTEYYIMVHGYSSGVGDFELTITCDIPVELQSFTIE